MMWTYLDAWIGTHFRSEEGAAMVEYGILVAGIAVLVLGAVFLLGGKIKGLFDGIDLSSG
jgi:pilus assembly protein Flp/PilA